MGRISRVVLPGRPHHVTQRGVRSLAVFRGDKDRRLYLRLLAEQAEAHGLRFLSWCLMTNHVHLIVVPPAPDALARAIGKAHRRYTSWANRREGLVGYLFQGRFCSCPLDEPHALSAIRYVERNPVRAAIVGKAWEYEWSSAAFRVGQREIDPLVQQEDLLGTPSYWRSLLERDPREIGILRKALRTGRPCGNLRFIKRAEKETGRRFRPGARGRPRKRNAAGG